LNVSVDEFLEKNHLDIGEVNPNAAFVDAPILEVATFRLKEGAENAVLKERLLAAAEVLRTIPDIFQPYVLGESLERPGNFFAFLGWTSRQVGGKNWNELDTTDSPFQAHLDAASSEPLQPFILSILEVADGHAPHTKLTKL
jgi:hypothetical protein